MNVLSQSEDMMIRVATELSATDAQKFGELLGLINGDGSISKGRVSFYNTNMYCVKKYLNNFCKIFKIKKNKFWYGLDYHTTYKFNKIANKWNTYLRVKKRISFQKDERNKQKNGMIRIVIYNVKIAKFIKERILKIQNLGEKNKDILLGFLRGFFATEGCVTKGKVHKEVPCSLQFPQKDKKILYAICEILKKFDIDSRVVTKQKKADYYCVNITAFENFKKFYDLGIADLYPEKKKKIKIGLKSYKRKISRRLSTATKVLGIIYNGPLNRYDIYEKTKLGKQHVNGILYDKKSYLLKNRYIEKFIDNNQILWKVTDMGKRYLNKVR